MHDVSEVFGQIWFPGLLLKLWNILPASYFLFFKSYLNYRSFSTKVGNQISLIRKIWNFSSCYFSPILFNIYTSDQPITPHTFVADYADDKAIISIHGNHYIVVLSLQFHLENMVIWYNRYKNLISLFIWQNCDCK